jgi:hypothetical protein
MRGGNENKTGIADRLINSMVKPPPEKKKLRAKSPVHKFSYQLPKSFFHAVDNARVEAGYDVLPHFHHLSISPSSKKHRENGQKHAHSSSSSDHDVASKKAQVRRTNHEHSHHHHHHHRQKKGAESSLASSSPGTSKTSSSKRSDAK